MSTKRIITLVITLLLLLFGYHYYYKVCMSKGTISVEGGEVTYFKYSNYASRNNTPLVVVNGGPGVDHKYMKNLSQIAQERPVVFYDQLGCGESKTIDETQEPKELWSLERYVKELEDVITELGYDNVMLLGHSWGGALALEYALNSPEKVEKLVLYSPLISTSRWSKDADILLNQLPSEIREVLKAPAKTEEEKVAFQAAEEEYNQLYVCRMEPWPANLKDSFDNINLNIYTHMWGNNEFSPTGVLATFDRWEDLPKLEMPVLFTCGRFDEARPETIMEAAGLPDNAVYRVFEKSAHVAHLEQEKEYLKELRAFLKD